MTAITMIGVYEVSGILGQGGMATVFKGYHRRLNRHVAIKMIQQAQSTDPGFRVRFEREAQIVANLEHPNIVPVYDISDHDGNPYLVMKFIEGCSLKEILNNGALQLSDIVQIIKPIAAAIDYAHTQGVLHRDIKPSNILLDKSSTPYLSDFGLARFAQQGESTLSADMVIGTPYYISPEQALGKVPVDSRADLYSFGVVLYELLVGRVPYNEGTPYSIIHDHIYQALPMPTTLNPHVPPAAELVLIRALAKDRDTRYPTATELVNALLDTLQSDATSLLRAEARHNAAESLARVRPLTPPPIVPGSVPSSSPTDNARTTLESAKVTPTSTPDRQRRGVPFGLALIAFVIMGIVILGVLRNNAQLRAAIDPIQAPTITRPPDRRDDTSPAPPIHEPTLFEVPLMNMRESGDYLNAHRDDPIAYLVRSRSLFNANRNVEGQRILLEGAALSDNPLAYALTAGANAIEDNNAEIAFEIYTGVLRQAAGTEAEQQVRTIVGAQLYALAANPSIYNSARLIAITTPFSPDDPPLVTTMVARALLFQERETLALAALQRVLDDLEGFSEAHLVLGELYWQQDRQQDARNEWRLARENRDSPQWVRDRADELLNNAQAVQ